MNTRVTSAPVAALLSVISAGVASAQVITPAQFKAACEAPGNTVTVVGTLKVSSPSLPPPLVTVNAGCLVQLTADAQFEADTVNMRFAGPVSFQANAKAGVAFKRAVWTAPSIAASLTGPEGSVLSDESRLTASTGNISIALGDIATLGITGPINGVGNALSAAGTLTVTAGEKFAGSFETTRLRAGTGMSFSLAGPEAVFTANNSSFVSAAGQFALTSPGRSAQVGLAGGQVTAPAGIAIALPGAESTATMVGTRATALAGSVALQAGGAGQSFGVLKMDRAIVRAGGAFTMIASVGANKGEVVLENSRVTAGAMIFLRSDAEGLTNVLNNTLSSPSEIRAFTGASGACIAEGNLATAPLVAICQ